MLNQFSRTELLIGTDGIKKLSSSRVAIFGLGGVGGYTVEALVRSGVGELDLIDDDKICMTNINRQILATHSTIGKYKVDIAEERILDINPKAIVHKYKTFFTPQTSNEFDFSKYDYVVDAIDTVVGKLEIICKCKELGIPVISSMGAGNKMHPELFEVADISKTSVCPLAKVIRQELKKRRIRKVKVVYSKEIPIKPNSNIESSCKTHCVCPPGTVRKCTAKNQIPGSNAFVPSVVGLIIASEVIRDIVES